jgi:hypothetical protein
MRGIFSFLLPAAVLAAASCRQAPAAAGASASLTLRRVSPRAATLVDGPARARYCGRDSVLWFVAIGSRWTGAISLRTPRPWATHFVVQQGLKGVDSAAIAARPIADSVGVAIVAERGTVDLTRGDTVSGQFSFETGSDSTLQRFSGSFRAVRPDSTGCGNP